MKIGRFEHDRLALVEDGAVFDVTEILESLPSLRWPLPPGDLVIQNLARLRPLIEAAKARAPRKRLDEVLFDSPVANPSRIIAAPLNYRLHVAEASNPAINHGVHMPGFEGFSTPIDKFGLFLKSQTGLVGPAQGVELQFPGRRNDHEVELAVVIGRAGRNILRAEALSYVAGYSIALDMVVRGPEDRSFRKSPDSYSVLGPWLVTADEIGDPGRLDFGIEVNGAPRQRANTRDLIVDVPDLIVRASAIYTLYPGDVIMTGTPDNVAEVTPGCTMHAWIEKIGEMDVHVR